MTDRTAIDTIKGYFYQFDFAIAKLLELGKPTDTIIVEGKKNKIHPQGLCRLL